MNIKYWRQISRLYTNIMPNIMDIKTFVFLDLETTGLPQYEFGATKITELSLIAVQANHIRQGVLPRVQNKLSLCFNPRKCIQSKAAEITGLCNELLEFQEAFSVDTIKLIENFLNVQYKPVCLVAHNGNRFDFPIFRTEIKRTGCEFSESIMCVDSLPMFRDLYQEDMEKPSESTTDGDIPIELMDGFDEFLCALLDDIDATEAKSKGNVEKIQRENETTPKRYNKKDSGAKETLLDSAEDKSNSKASSSVLDLYFNPPALRENKPVLRKPTTKRKLFKGVPFTLSSVYERLTKKVAVGSHRAECDTNLLLECAVVYADRFVTYSNANSKQLEDIPLINIGQKICN